MTDTQETPEIVFTFTALDDAVLTEAEAVFGQDDVSSSKRMTGGTTLVDVFIRPVAELIGKVLDFKARQGDRIVNATLIIDKEKISLVGYGADEAQRILDSEGFQKALATLRG